LRATRDIHIHKALLALLSLCDFYSVVSGYLQTANKTWYSKGISECLQTIGTAILPGGRTRAASID